MKKTRKRKAMIHIFLTNKSMKTLHSNRKTLLLSKDRLFEQIREKRMQKHRKEIENERAKGKKNGFEYI